MKEFGVSYDPSIPYRASWDCPECGWSWFQNQPDDAVAGFTPEQPFVRNIVVVTGILIIECPNDFSKFWFHTSFDDEMLEDARARIEAEEKELKMSVKIPDAVKARVGEALKPEQLQAFWTTPHTRLDNKSPQELWATPEGRKQVMAFIVSAKLGKTT